MASSKHFCLNLSVIIVIEEVKVQRSRVWNENVNCQLLKLFEKIKKAYIILTPV